MLKAFGIETCAGLIANRGLLAALFSPVSVNFFMAAALGIGRTQHGEPVEEGAIGRKGISNERTFQAMSAPAELEAKASFCRMPGHWRHIDCPNAIVGFICRQTQYRSILKVH